ncbi:MAG: type IV pilus assembly protein PilM [Acidobacteriota bacterium]
MIRSKNLVGLDIGSSSIKIVELKSKKLGGKEFYKLKKIGYELLPSNTIVDGTIIESNSVIESIKKLSSEIKLKNKHVATSVSGTSVIVKKLVIPKIDPEEIEESIMWEAKHFITFPLDEVNIDYSIIERPEKEPGDRMDIILAAVKKEKINEYTSVILRTGKIPEVVDIDSFALQNALEVNYETSQNGLIALINIGASITNVNILDGDTSILIRDILFGGNQFSEIIQKEFGLSFEKAERIKKGESVDGVSFAIASPLIDMIFNDLKLEIIKTFDFVKTNTHEKKVRKIFICGGCSKIPGLKNFLLKGFDVPVEILNPFRNIQINEKIFNRDYIDEIAPFFGVAVGLALRKIKEH